MPYWSDDFGERQPPAPTALALVVMGAVLAVLLVGIAVYGVATSHDSPAVQPSPMGSATALADNPEGNPK